MCERCDVLRWESHALSKAWHAIPENRMRAREARVARIAYIIEAFDGWIASGDPFGEWRAFREFEGSLLFPWELDPNWDPHLENDVFSQEDKFLRMMDHAWDNVALYERRWDWDWVTNPPY